MTRHLYLGSIGGFLVAEEVQFVVPLAETRNINVVQALQGGCWVQLVWLDHLYRHLEPGARG